MSVDVSASSNAAPIGEVAPDVSSVLPTDIAFGRTIVPVPLPKRIRKDDLQFEYAEHSYIGDSIYLTLASDERVLGIDHKFRMKNGLVVTYGQINGLAGDFYATTKPISDGKDAQDQAKRFIAAYNTLADGGSRQPGEAQSILKVLQTEVDAVNEALKHHIDPSIIYNKLPDVTAALQLITVGRPSDFPSYLGLAKINWDHFGEDARKAYNAGHATALHLAAQGDLEGAYALNAFADHFLEDSFSAGHLRTPRRVLHKDSDPTADLCAKFMHDEDNAIGLTLQNPRGDKWTAFGDKRALDAADKENKTRCVAAVQASADEIYAAYKTKNIPSPDNYKAWAEAPTLASARGPQVLGPLFHFNGERRDDIRSRRSWKSTNNYWFWSTALDCKNSGWWTYPITLDGPPKVLPWSSIAVTSPKLWYSRLFYQNAECQVMESDHMQSSWTEGPQTAGLFRAAPFSPLAAISWKDGAEVRVYYLNEQFILQEHCFSQTKGAWYAGELNSLNIKAAMNSAIAALTYTDEQGVHIRVYLQEDGSNTIQEYCNDGAWVRGAVLPAALSGTALAAITYPYQGLQIRVYYQAEDLSIREHCWSTGRGWFTGELEVGKAPGRTPISALGYPVAGGGVVLRVFWASVQGELVQIENTGRWGAVSSIVGQLKPGVEFAAAQWDDGKHLRVYYQSADDSMLEICNEGNGWFSGATVVNAHD